MLATDERKRRHLGHAEPLRDVGALVDVDLLHAQCPSFLASDVRKEALHPPGRARAARREEDEQGTAIWGHSEVTVERVPRVR